MSPPLGEEAGGKECNAIDIPDDVWVARRLASMPPPPPVLEADGGGSRHDDWQSALKLYCGALSNMSLVLTKLAAGSGPGPGPNTRASAGEERKAGDDGGSGGGGGGGDGDNHHHKCSNEAKDERPVQLRILAGAEAACTMLLKTLAEVGEGNALPVQSLRVKALYRRAESRWQISCAAATAARGR